ncbi:MAG: PAS domain S-box protein, partial [Planctomycetes bacterium]|nr:PAS domain S-box protein [Planctomycetota bacterium]
DEIVGKKTWADLIIPEQKQQFEKHWHDITTKGRVRDLEYTLVHKSGFTVNVVLNASSRFDTDGNLISTRGSVLNITNRKRVEKDLTESRQMLELILDTIPTHVFWKDRESTFLGCNRHFAEDAGLKSSDEIVGKTDFELTWKEQALLYRADDKAVIESGEPKVDYEEPQTWHDGTSLWLRTSKIPLRDSEDNIIGVLGTYEDITERKLAQAQIENLAKFPSEDPSPVLRIAGDGSLLYANDASESILAEWDCQPGQPVPGSWLETVKRTIESGSPEKIEFSHKGKILSFMVTPVAGAGYVNIYARDVTERTRAEETLKYRFDLEELITRISAEFINLKSYEIDDAIDRALEAVTEAVCVDRSYVFLYSDNGKKMDNTNEWCREGVPPHKQRLQGLDADIFPWFNERMKSRQTMAVPCVADLDEGLEAEKAEWQLEAIQSLLCVPIVCKDKLVGFIGFDTVLYQTDWPEDIVKFLTIVGNIFANALDRKISELERELLVKTLATKNKELQSVVYVASHDLRSPLINIQGFSGELVKNCRQLLEYLGLEDISDKGREDLKPILEEDIPQALEFITASTDKMQTLLDGLLKISRIGTSPLKIEPLDMNQLVKQVVDAMNFQIQSCDAVVTVDELPPCLGDAGRTSQVFSNLLDNAVKYLDPGREDLVRVTGRSEDNRCIYCVEDNGVGIDEDYQAKVFEIFHRLDPGGSVPGEGLGLTIISRILDRQDGNILLDSKPDRGSRFYISLPSVSV